MLFLEESSGALGLYRGAGGTVGGCKPMKPADLGVCGWKLCFLDLLHLATRREARESGGGMATRVTGQGTPKS